MAITYHPIAHWKIAGSYSYLNVHQAVSAAAPAGTVFSIQNETPAHQVKLQSYWNIGKAVQLDAHLFYSSSFPALYLDTDANIPTHLRVDVRLGWRIKPRWEVSLVGQDLSSRWHLELTPEAFSPATCTGRGAYLKSAWRF